MSACVVIVLSPLEIELDRVDVCISVQVGTTKIKYLIKLSTESYRGGIVIDRLAPA